MQGHAALQPPLLQTRGSAGLSLNAQVGAGLASRAWGGEEEDHLPTSFNPANPVMVQCTWSMHAWRVGSGDQGRWTRPVLFRSSDRSPGVCCCCCVDPVSLGSICSLASRQVLDDMEAGSPVHVPSSDQPRVRVCCGMCGPCRVWVQHIPGCAPRPSLVRPPVHHAAPHGARPDRRADPARCGPRAQASRAQAGRHRPAAVPHGRPRRHAEHGRAWPVAVVARCGGAVGQGIDQDSPRLRVRAVVEGRGAVPTRCRRGLTQRHLALMSPSRHVPSTARFRAGRGVGL